MHLQPQLNFYLHLLLNPPLVNVYYTRLLPSLVPQTKTATPPHTPRDLKTLQPYKMATDNNILGLRAQIAGNVTAAKLIIRTDERTANMKALDISSTADIVTVMINGNWEALIVEGSKITCRCPNPSDSVYDSVEAALKFLLERLSIELYRDLRKSLK